MRAAVSGLREAVLAWCGAAQRLVGLLVVLRVWAVSGCRMLVRRARRQSARGSRVRYRATLAHGPPAHVLVVVAM